MPGQLSIWERFKTAPPFPSIPQGGIGSPDQVRETLEKFEAVGVDQVVFIQQGGNNRHEHICESLELFAARVLPGFKERHEAARRHKDEALAPYVARALERMRALETPDQVAPVESYPVLMQTLGIDMQQLMEMQGRSLATALDEWKRKRAASSD